MAICEKWVFYGCCDGLYVMNMTLIYQTSWLSYADTDSFPKLVACVKGSLLAFHECIRRMLQELKLILWVVQAYLRDVLVEISEFHNQLCGRCWGNAEWWSLTDCNSYRSLPQNDKVQRCESCDLILTRLETDDEFTIQLMFSDKTTFHTNGSVNRHNVRIWGEQKLYTILEHSRDLPKVNIFCAMSYEKVYGPFFQWIHCYGQLVPLNVERLAVSSDGSRFRWFCVPTKRGSSLSAPTSACSS